MTDFKQLRVSQLALELVIEISRTTATFPAPERFGLVSQMRRAATSVGANIAEGAGRNTDGEFARFLRLARGSAHELEFQALAARDLDLLDEPRANLLQERIGQLSRMLTMLIRHVAPADH
jgi:four helix bundle protein